MAFAHDLSCLTPIAEAPFVRAVGWLDAAHMYAEGIAANDFVDKLHMLALHSDESALALSWPEATEPHLCELCEDFETCGNLGIPGGNVLYVAPAMILHYVTDHRYQPPEEFRDAVARCPLPGSRAYAEAVAAFSDSRPLDWNSP